MSKFNDSSSNPCDWSWEKIEGYLSIFDHISVGYHDNYPREPFSGHGTPVLKVIDVSPTKSAEGKLTLSILASSNWFDNDVHRIFSDTHLKQVIDGVEASEEVKQKLKDALEIDGKAHKAPYIANQNKE